MNHYHVVIATERRKAPRELAIEISANRGTEEAPQVVTQLHSMGTRIDNIEDANILYAAELDAHPNPRFMRVLKGKLADLTMAYGGWPMMDEKDFMKESE